MKRFLAVNGGFFLVFVGLAILQPPLWVWLLLVGVWCLADYVLAWRLDLAWWHWLLLLAVLAIVYSVVLHLTGRL